MRAFPRRSITALAGFLIAKSTKPEGVVSKPVERLSELNHDKPRVLSDFLRWGMKKYPADRYGLVF